MTEDEIIADPLATIRNHLFTAVIGDVMDVMGHQNQFLPPQIRPLDPKFQLVGRAMPVVEADVTEPSAPGAPQFGLMFEALDDLKPGEIYICSGSHNDYALWGELMTHRARHLQANGAVLAGYVRDTD
ncbi:MAG: RraA family protein, partial [Paracoccaceae bacterium]